MNPKKMRFIIVFLVLVCLQCGQRQEEREKEKAEHVRSHNDRMKIVRLGKSDSLVLHHTHTHTCKEDDAYS